MNVDDLALKVSRSQAFQPSVNQSETQWREEPRPFDHPVMEEETLVFQPIRAHSHQDLTGRSTRALGCQIPLRPYAYAALPTHSAEICPRYPATDPPVRAPSHLAACYHGNSTTDTQEQGAEENSAAHYGAGSSRTFRTQRETRKRCFCNSSTYFVGVGRV
ncbi:hypothetical protein SKAU_G00223670 [Synaphobranchus kaupii]|uniref:Uncharacterized protein n=1 Tax=Synaphobranchus kaupii TaxID=118154 RepID=A0A9Q1FBF0_SYNKA|nr:hypothetical protein SKAU_G00223670 [Synaphobranchus kaupii]